MNKDALIRLRRAGARLEAQKKNFDTLIRQHGTDAQLDAQKRMRDVQTQVKQLCCSHGAPVILMSMYMAFGLELLKLQRQEISGETAVMEAEVHRSKWVARGLKSEVLEAIRSGLFNIPAPTP